MLLLCVNRVVLTSTIYSRYRRQTDRQTTYHDNSRTLQCNCNVRLMIYSGVVFVTTSPRQSHFVESRRLTVTYGLIPAENHSDYTMQNVTGLLQLLAGLFNYKPMGFSHDRGDSFPIFQSPSSIALPLYVDATVPTGSNIIVAKK